jgi:hypothetical protein
MKSALLLWCVEKEDDPLEEMDRNLEGWNLLALQTPLEDKRDPTAVWLCGGVVDVSAMWKE